MNRLLLVPLLALLASCAWPRSTFRLDELSDGGISWYEDRVAIMLESEKGSPWYCPGFRGKWVGTDFFYEPVRARVGEQPDVDYPADVTPEYPWHATVWITTHHIARDATIRLYRCDENGTCRQTGGRG